VFRIYFIYVLLCFYFIIIIIIIIYSTIFRGAP